MGELAKIDKWLTSIDDTRSELIGVAKGASPVAASFAMASARLQLLATLQDEAVRARLLAITDERVNMVELANTPTDDDRIQIMALALLSGFIPGRDEFAIFGGGFDKNVGKPRPGKLYIKAPGFRTLFGHLGITPDCQTGHPEWAALGTSGKKIWRVSGSASCEFRGVKYEVTATGENAIGLPGYESDNVAGITAKAQRRLLRDLWQKVSPILTDNYDDSDTEPQPEVPTITHVDVDWKTELAAHGGESSDVWMMGVLIRDAPGQAERDAVMDAATKKRLAGKIDQRGFDTLERYWEHKSQPEVG